MLVRTRRTRARFPVPSFTETIRDRAALESPAAASETADAVLETLGEAVSHGEAADLAASLDDRFANDLLQAEPSYAEPPDLGEFVARVADRLDVASDEAMRRCQAVFAALTATVGEDEAEDARAQFPPSYEVLFEPGEALGRESFADAVQDHGNFESRREALRAAEATLETLGERLSKGEAQDVARYLPDQAAEWLVPDTPARALDYSFDEFVEKVASREEASVDAAIEDADAVTDVVAAMVGEEELRQMESQLPETYEPMFH